MVVQLLIKLRQSGNTDTMLSSCMAHTSGGSGSGPDHQKSAYYDLTDYLGCAVDPDILPDFGASFNSKTETKRLTSAFPMFKFPDAETVNVKCTVLVCETNCPIAKCPSGNEVSLSPCCAKNADF